MKEYTTIFEPVEAEFVERRSRFVGYLTPAATAEEALAALAKRREQFWDANHNVYAYLLRDGRIQRYSDDGEPQGTAGVPVLDVLQKEGLVDVMAVVTRYFGGVLLGAGGLVRAYSHAAALACAAARRKTVCECTELEICCGYDLYGRVSFLLPQFEAKTTFSNFGAEVCLHVLLKDCFVGRFEKELTERTSALVTPRLLERRFACLEEETGKEEKE